MTSCAGQRFSGSADPATRAAAAAIEAAAEEEIRAKKAAKKAAFDTEYDEGGRDVAAWEVAAGVGGAVDWCEGGVRAEHVFGSVVDAAGGIRGAHVWF